MERQFQTASQKKMKEKVVFKMKKIIIPCILLLFFSCSTMSQGEAGYLLRSADLRGDIGEYEAALENYARILELYPNHIEALNARSALYNRMGLYDEALIDTNQVLSIVSDNIDALNTRSYTYAYLGQYEDALNDINTVLSFDPSNTTALHNKSIFLTKIGDNSKAVLENINKAINVEPNNGKLYNTRGNIYFEMSNYDLAYADFLESIELAKRKKETYDSYVKLGNIDMIKERYNIAIVNYTEALNVDSSDSELYNLLGIAYDSIDNCELAIEMFTKAIIRNKEAHYYFNRATCHIHTKEYTLALNDYKQFEKLFSAETTNNVFTNEDLFEFHKNSGVAQYNLENYDEALESFSSALAIDATDSDLYYYRVIIYIDNDSYFDALSDLTTLIELNPNTPSLYEHRADIYELLADRETDENLKNQYLNEYEINLEKARQ